MGTVAAPLPPRNRTGGGGASFDDEPGAGPRRRDPAAPGADFALAEPGRPLPIIVRSRWRDRGTVPPGRISP